MHTGSWHPLFLSWLPAVGHRFKKQRGRSEGDRWLTLLRGELSTVKAIALEQAANPLWTLQYLEDQMADGEVVPHGTTAVENGHCDTMGVFF